jgi:hypothetical protein
MAVLGTVTMGSVVDLASDLNVIGESSFSNMIKTYGVMSHYNAVMAASNMTVLGTSTLNGVNIISDVSVGGVATLSSNVTTWGVASFSNAARFSSNLACLGCVAIGPTVNNTYPLYVQGVANDASGISIRTDGTVSSSSDARLKTDVRKIEGALDKVLAIGGYTYRRTGDPLGPRSVGVLAQEVAAVLPELVGTDSDGTMHVAYANVVALLIEAIKELSSKIQP